MRLRHEGQTSEGGGVERRAGELKRVSTESQKVETTIAKISILLQIFATSDASNIASAFSIRLKSHSQPLAPSLPAPLTLAERTQ